MTPRERVLTSLKHKEPDRVPIDIGQTALTGISQIAYKNLLKYLGKEKREVKILDIMQQLATVDEDILEEFGVDIRGVYMGEPEDWTLKITEDEKNFYFHILILSISSGSESLRGLLHISK